TLSEWIRALKDADRSVRRSAARAIRNVGPTTRNPIGMLEQALNDPDEGVCLEAAKALAVLDPFNEKPVPVLAAVLRDRNLRERWTFLKTVGKIAARPLVRGVFDTNAPFQLERAWVRLQWSERDAYWKRVDAAKTLYKLGPVARSARPALTQAVQDDEGLVRLYAESALQRLNEGQSWQKLKLRSQGIGLDH